MGGGRRNEDGASDLRAENNGDRGDKTQLMNKSGGTRGGGGRRRELSSSTGKSMSEGSALLNSTTECCAVCRGTQEIQDYPTQSALT